MAKRKVSGYTDLFILSVFLVIGFFTPATAQTVKKTSTDSVPFNPIIRDKFTADLAALVVGNTVYIYTGHDEAPKGNTWMELITPSTATVLAYYDHPVWEKYAAITQNKYGKGLATYIGCSISNAVADKLLEDVVKKVGMWGDAQKLTFPVITKSGINVQGKTIRYLFNYSGKATSVSYPFAGG